MKKVKKGDKTGKKPVIKKTAVSAVKEVEKIVKDLTKLMGVDVKYVVDEDEKNQVINVNLETENEKGLLIGKKGETLYSLQYILALMLNQKIGEWKRIQVNIGDWKEKQDEYLKELAQKAAERARETGEPQYLYNLNSAQRRIVHLEISMIKGAVSESEGEGSERRLVVKAE